MSSTFDDCSSQQYRQAVDKDIEYVESRLRGHTTVSLPNPRSKISGLIVEMTMFVLYGSHVTIKAIKIALKEKEDQMGKRNKVAHLRVRAAF